MTAYEKAREEERKEVVLAGIGGQGLVYIGRMLGEAAVKSGYHAVQTQSYGVASRGGFTKSEVVFSDKPPAYPMAVNPQIILALSEEAYNRYVDQLDVGDTMVYDSDQVDSGGSDQKVCGFPLTTIARELEIMDSYNLLALGVFISSTGLLPEDSIVQILQDGADTTRGKQNLRAFQEGVSLVE